MAPLPRWAGLRARAGDARQQRRLDRLARRHRLRHRAVRGRRPHPGPGHHVGAGAQRVLRGLLQRHPVAALPRPRRQAVLPPRVVGVLRDGQPAVRRRGREVRRQGRDRLGAGLPAPAGPGDAARAAPRPPDRLLPAHPVPAGRAVLAAAVAAADPRGPARGRPGRLPALRRGAELRPPRPPAGRPQDPPRRGLPPRRPRRPGARVPHLDRRGRLRGAGPLRAGRGRAPRRSGATSATRRSCSSASTGSTTPRASTPGCARSAS